MKKSSTLFLFTLLLCVYAHSNPLKNFSNQYSPASEESIRTNLYIVGKNGAPTLVDGDFTQYDPSYSDAVDGLDARKISNFSENIGMIRQGTTLVIERRHTIEKTDSIFYNIWNLKKYTYQLEFITSNLNHPGLIGYVEDSYLHTNTSLDLNGSNHINFTINSDAASFAMNRFRIIFTTTASALPLSFTSVKASEERNGVNIDWQTANEKNIQQYSVERAADSSHFISLENKAAYNGMQNNYSWTDTHPLAGNNYYRIHSVAADGGISYSQVLKICTGKAITAMRIFPNPVINNTIYLQMADQPLGDYTIKLITTFGQVSVAKQIHHSEAGSNEKNKPWYRLI